MDYKKLADLLFPNNKLTVAEIEKMYPKRQLKEGQVVSRYAPSPTGMMHIGNFFQMFISYNLCRVTDGTIFLRVEDTDGKRTITDAVGVIYDILNRFGIKFNEYQTLDGVDIGNYGPYVQSQRAEIYKAYAKKLVSEGKAFPCFCKKTEGKDEVLRNREEKGWEDDTKDYDPCRDLSYEDVLKHIENGDKFAIRLRTKNEGTERIKFFDLLKGEIEAKANAKDFVLLKNDGIPPYAFAHAIDDTLMGTTVAVRGQEYLSSAPMHVELFDALGFKQMTYCHNPLISKIDEKTGNKRKISKRYDPEANMMYYFEQGIPTTAVFEYLLNIINSGFEKWREDNPTLPWTEFKFGVNDITAVAPIFDMAKLLNISKNVIARMSADEVYEAVLNWAKEFDEEFYYILRDNKKFAIQVFNIDRGGEKPRKDIAKWIEVKDYYDFMFLPYKYLSFATLSNAKITKQIMIDAMNKYLLNYSEKDDKQTWFEKVKNVASECGFCVNNKEYKLNPDAYTGNTADFCAVIRLVVTGRTEGMDLYSICSVLGKEELQARLNEFKAM